MHFFARSQLVCSPYSHGCRAEKLARNGNSDITASHKPPPGCQWLPLAGQHSCLPRLLICSVGIDSDETKITYPKHMCGVVCPIRQNLLKRKLSGFRIIHPVLPLQPAKYRHMISGESAINALLPGKATPWLITYLTGKGASVDESIQWSSSKSCSYGCNASDGSRKRRLQCPTQIQENIKIRCSASMVCEFKSEYGSGPKVVKCEDDDPTWLLSPTSSSVSQTRGPQVEIRTRPPSVARQGSTNSISSSGSGLFSSSGSFCFTTHIVPQATVVFIDIQGFTAQCAAMPAGRVGEWIAAFYQLVDAAAAAHGVTRVESRGDCCVCVCGAEGTAPPAPPTANSAAATAAPAAADSAESQASRMLAFAANLHAKVAALPVGSGGGHSAGLEQDTAGTAVRMGMATGEVVFYIVVSNGVESAPCVSVQGATAALAARMEALAAPGLARVHRSTADKWAAETREAPPATAPVEGATERAAERAAVYDCAARAFRPDSGFKVPAVGRDPGPCAGRDGWRWRRLSAPF